jgi:tetratricopeptide (TPR) repeat protein
MQYLKPVVLDLIHTDNRMEAWSLIDIYYKHAKTLADYDVLGYLALKSDKRDTYLECAEASYALAKTSEQKYTARMNLYKAYNAMNMPEKALFYIEQNLQITPDDFETQCQRAFNISLSGQKETAEQLLESLVEQYPEKEKSLESAFSGKLLRSGDLANGIRSFIEAFKPTNGMFEKELKMKRWDGIIRPGSTLYVDGEGGIGDEIINIRFFDKLKSYGITPILYSKECNYRKDTDALFQRHGYKVINDHYSINQKMQWVPLMSLPAYLNLTEKDLWNGPYLKPLRNPKNKIQSNRFKIGIKCSGNPYFGQDEYRKIPIDVMLKHLPKETDIYYIDKEIGHPDTINLGDRIDSWEDTLDFIDQMDCIVSSCTSLVHAAGALGKTTFVAVPIAEYYIWTTSETGTKSPWYGDNFFIMRQTKVRDWEYPLSEINYHVTKLMKEAKRD